MRRVRIAADLGLATPQETVHFLRALRPEPDAAWPGSESVRRGFELGSLDDADVAVLAMRWEEALSDAAKRERALEFCARAERSGLTVFVFYHGDDPVRPPARNAVLFAHALHASRRWKNEIALPCFVPDPLAGVEPEPRPRRDMPVVGFCGQAWPLGLPSTGPVESILRRVRYAGGALLAESGLNNRFGAPVTFYHRAEALRRLEPDRRVETRFIIRDGRTPIDRDAYRREYVENMVGSDYALTVRGVGNFSYRLYEVLSWGRIPLFVDTDCVLPLASEIDWRALCLWVDGKDVRAIGDRLVSAHRALSNEEFRERQMRCRHTWLTRLTGWGFFDRVGERLARALSHGTLRGNEGSARLLRALS